MKIPRPRWPQRARARLAATYALLFLVAGAGLLALTYALAASSLPTPRSSAAKVTRADSKQLITCKQQPFAQIPSNLLKKCESAFHAGAEAAAQNQRSATLSTLLLGSLIGLGAITLVSGALGWIVAGRVLSPIRKITETARRASELHLGDRLALSGPEDELKELADTFDLMLERLDAAFASQKRFVANAAHELRTPLTAMRTTIEVTLSKPERTPEQLEAMADRVRRSTEQAEATIDALLTLAVSERGAGAHEPVDLATAAEDALDAAAPEIARLKLTVESTLDQAATEGDPVLLERMVANLIDNAVRHNHPSGWVQIRTGDRDGSAFLEVANTGPVVAEAELPALMEPFARAQRSADPSQGVGLGLSIASAIGTAHGAGLITHSRPEGGLEISVALPRGGARG